MFEADSEVIKIVTVTLMQFPQTAVQRDMGAPPIAVAGTLHLEDSKPGQEGGWVGEQGLERPFCIPRSGAVWDRR